MKTYRYIGEPGQVKINDVPLKPGHTLTLVAPRDIAALERDPRWEAVPDDPEGEKAEPVKKKTTKKKRGRSRRG